MNQVAIVFGLIITSVVGFGAYTALAPLVTQSENRNMEAEIINVINAATEYRWVNRGALGDADFKILVTNGYLDSELYDDGGRRQCDRNSISPPTMDADSSRHYLRRRRHGKL